MFMKSKSTQRSLQDRTACVDSNKGLKSFSTTLCEALSGHPEALLLITELDIIDFDKLLWVYRDAPNDQELGRLRRGAVMSKIRFDLAKRWEMEKLNNDSKGMLEAVDVQSNIRLLLGLEQTSEMLVSDLMECTRMHYGRLERENVLPGEATDLLVKSGLAKPKSTGDRNSPLTFQQFVLDVFRDFVSGLIDSRASACSFHFCSEPDKGGFCSCREQDESSDDDDYSSGEASVYNIE